MSTRARTDLIVDPITLKPTTSISLHPFIDARVGPNSNKNNMELKHFLKNYNPQPDNKNSYLTRIKALPAPLTSHDSVILDIGCGPYDCIADIDGHHLYLDDIMDSYITELSAKYDGLPISARTELMPLKTDSVDIIYSINMIDHVDDMPETIFEMHRILKNGGKIIMQSYFNSHPLLETEPGVFDRSFLDNYIIPFFDVEFLKTFAIGDPSISASYTMDIIALVLSKKNVPLPTRKARDRYNDAAYLGPQSIISTAISKLTKGGSARELIDLLADEPCYQIHYKLLEAWEMIISEQFGPANVALKELLKIEQVRKNPYARIAVLTLENRRITQTKSAR